MILELEQLKQVIPNNQNVDEWLASLQLYFPQYNSDTDKRISAFLAECSVETGNFTQLKENLNYSADALVRVWPLHFPNLTIANQYAHNRINIANRAYANRMGNGPESSNDGSKYIGRGLIQVTGKDNYTIMATDLGMNIVDLPEYFLTCDGAVHSACAFWQRHKLNTLADSNNIDSISKIINGGTIGLQQRRDKYKSILSILGD